jgi:hypothetical protein
MIRVFATVILLLFTVALFAQTNQLSCKDLHQLQFYCYPKNSSDVFLCKRQGDTEVDYNLTKKDSTIWKLE